MKISKIKNLKKKFFIGISLFFALFVIIRLSYSDLIEQTIQVCRQQIHAALDLLNDGIFYEGNSFIFDESESTFRCQTMGNFGKENSLYFVELTYVPESSDPIIEEFDDNFNIIKNTKSPDVLIKKANGNSGFTLRALQDNVLIEVILGSGAFENKSDEEVIAQLEMLVKELPVENFKQIQLSFLHSIPLLTGKRRISLNVENYTQTLVSNGTGRSYPINGEWR